MTPTSIQSFMEAAQAHLEANNYEIDPMEKFFEDNLWKMISKRDAKEFIINETRRDINRAGHGPKMNIEPTFRMMRLWNDPIAIENEFTNMLINQIIKQNPEIEMKIKAIKGSKP